MKICAASSSSPSTATCLGPTKRAWPTIDANVRLLAQPLLDALVRDLDDRVLPRLDRLHVDPDRPFDHHPELRGAARDVGGAGARDQGLGRDAAVVDAGAAEALALDDRDPLAGRGETVGERRTGLAGADDDGIETTRHVLSPAHFSRSAPRRAARDAGPAFLSGASRLRGSARRKWSISRSCAQRSLVTVAGRRFSPPRRASRSSCSTSATLLTGSEVNHIAAVA